MTRLLVIQSNTGFLFKVNPKTGVTKKVDLGTTTLPAGDGLLLQDRTILNVVQNAGQITVLKLDRSYTPGRWSTSSPAQGISTYRPRRPRSASSCMW